MNTNVQIVDGEVSDKLTNARSAIVTRAAFFASILLKQGSIPNYNIERFAVNGEELHFNPEFVRTQTKEQLWFDLLVASSHTFLKHPFRKRSTKQTDPEYKEELFDEACGVTAINVLHESGFTLPEGYTYQHEYAGRAVESVYRKLKELAQEEPDGGGGDGEDNDKPDGEKGSGDSDSDEDGDGEGDSGGDGDDEKDDDEEKQKAPPKNLPCNINEIQAATEEEAQYKEAKADMDSASAAMAAKSQGDLSANLDRMVKQMREPVIPPEEILERFASDVVRAGNDWNRRAKRHYNNPVFLPRKRTEATANKLVNGWDTSGSITEHMVQRGYEHMFACLYQIEEYGSDPELTSICCDYDVCHVEELRADIKPTIKGGGGTRFSPVFEYIIKNDLDPKGVIYWTDGFCGGEENIIGKYGREVQDICPILWVLIEQNDYFIKEIAAMDFGECLQLPPDWLQR